LPALGEALEPMPLRTDLVSGAACDRVAWQHHAATEAMGQGESEAPDARGRVGNRDSIVELGIATAAPGMNPLSALAPHPGEQLQKQRPADAPGGVEQPPDREQPSHVRRQSSGFERHDDEHVDEGQR